MSWDTFPDTDLLPAPTSHAALAAEVAMIATSPTIIPLLSDASIEIHPATDDWPVCLRVSDGEMWCSVDLSLASWAVLKAKIEEAMSR